VTEDDAEIISLCPALYFLVLRVVGRRAGLMKADPRPD